LWDRGTTETEKRQGNQSIRLDPRPARLLYQDRDRKNTMIDGLLLAAATTVILVLYHKVKAWDERQGTAPVRR
jgi:hypothetical protein